VQKKVPTEIKDMPDTPDDEVAKVFWENHLKRDQSIIVDLFQGQLKSKLVCPKCNHVSITFDPYMYLSLPLPTEVRFVAKYLTSSRETQCWKSLLPSILTLGKCQ
jgi:ubiquitin carboxyl-terminal hydrolase 4/11/15